MRDLDPEWASLAQIGIGVALAVATVFLPIERSEGLMGMANFLAGMGARGLGTAIESHYRDGRED